MTVMVGRIAAGRGAHPGDKRYPRVDRASVIYQEKRDWTHAHEDAAHAVSHIWRHGLRTAMVMLTP